MAYAAVGSLELTVERLLKASHISIVQNSSPQIIDLLYEEIFSFKETLREFDKRRSTINMKMVKTLEDEIIDAVHQFEDVIDPHLSSQFRSQYEQVTDHPPSMLFSVDLEGIKQNIDSLIERMNKMKRAYSHELCNPSPEGEELEDDVVPSRIDFGGNESSDMVGFSFRRVFLTVKHRHITSPSKMRLTVSLLGMAGIGKTAHAKKLFRDQFVVSSFTKHVFVTIGPKYQLEDILADILTQVRNPGDMDEIMVMKGEKQLAKMKWMVLDSLKSLSYFIVLDDVWDTQIYLDLVCLFPEDQLGSRVLVTTRLHNVATQCALPVNSYRVPFLDKKESWDLLREKVFGKEESCPNELEKAGMKIAENCEGLPLTIITVANILSKVEKTVQYWNEVAAQKQHSVYKDAYDQMMNVLYPSYDYLEQHSKACFLYFGAFPQKSSLNMYHLIKLWSVEGFLNREPVRYPDPTRRVHLTELHDKNVIMRNNETYYYYLHSSFWYMCNKEAAKTKLFYGLNCRADALPQEGIYYQPRRLCIRNNVLLAIEDVQNLMAYASTVRSLLCTGAFRKYPVPLCLENLRLLKVLNAPTIRLYEFPMEVLKLVQLRYLNLVYDGNLPTSISKLLNLQYLTVVQHSNVNSPGNPSYLPIEIWNMNELKNVHTTGRDLPHPCEGSLLPNLLTLAGVGPKTCTKDVLEKIPNLEILAIVIDLDPDATQPLSCFDHISHLHKLEEIECYINNPSLKTSKTEVVTPLAPLSDFPSSLTKLMLEGSFGYPWEEMRKISSLPNLRYLKLRCHAFQGPKWEVHDDEFQKLKQFIIEDTDLVQWKFVTPGNTCLPAFTSLQIGHCYKLKEIPLTFGSSLKKIRLIECNPMAVDCANKLKNEWENIYGTDSLVLDVISSL